MSRTASLSGLVCLTLGLAWPVQAQPRPGTGGGFTFQPKKTEQTRPESREMKRGLRFYERGDYHSASILFHRVVAGKTPDTAATREKAAFWMGKTLYHLRFYSSALNYFEELARKGRARTLPWLASLSRKMPESTRILKIVGRFAEINPAALDMPSLHPARDYIRYLLGRYHYGLGNAAGLKRALGHFGKVSRISDFYPRARMFAGIIYMRLRRPVRAARAFKAIVRYARRRKGRLGTGRFAELGRLSLARVFYQAGGVALKLAWQKRNKRLYRIALDQFRKAIRYYDSIPVKSWDWMQTLYEGSWAHFMLDAELRKVFLKDYQGYQKALGNIHALNSPYFENYFFTGLPESLILRAVVYYKNCRWKRAEETIAEFNKVYPPLYRRLTALAKKHPDDSDFYDYARKINRGAAGLPPRFARMARSALGDRTLLRHFKYIEELDREIKQISNAEPAWKSTAIAESVLKDLFVNKALAVSAAGALARLRLKRLARELGKLVGRATDIEFEIWEAKKGNIRISRSRGFITKHIRVRQPKVDDQHELWPFKGAYWRDELPFYRAVVRNACSVR